MNHTIRITVTVILMGFLLQATAQSQVENSMSQYFQNRMLGNPAFAGADGGKIYALQNRSWVGFDGAPVMTGISGEFLFGANSAMGLQVVSDVTGVLNRTTGILNYAYRIKFRKENELRIGVALSIAGEGLNSKYMDQGGVDPVLVSSINTEAQYDGTLGFVYADKKLSVGASFYRLRENFSTKKGGGADLILGQIGGTYEIDFNEKAALKPLMMLKLYQGTGSVLNIGAQFEYNRQFNSMLLYQTTGNIRAGLGLRLKEIADVNFFYDTNAKIANAASQQYELGIGFYLTKKKL